MSGPRNRYGVNDANDCYRTIHGARFNAWVSCPTPERIAAYREAGARVRRFGEELFVHEADDDIAASVDARLDAKETRP